MCITQMTQVEYSKLSWPAQFDLYLRTGLRDYVDTNLNAKNDADRFHDTIMSFDVYMTNYGWDDFVALDDLLAIRKAMTDRGHGEAHQTATIAMWLSKAKTFTELLLQMDLKDAVHLYSMINFEQQWP